MANPPKSDAAGAPAPRTTAAELRGLLCTAVRRPALFQLCCEHVTPDLFDETEAAALLFWKSVQEVLRHQHLPADPLQAAQVLHAQVTREAATDAAGTVYTPAVVRAVLDRDGWLYEAFACAPPGDEKVEWASRVLRGFLYERMVGDPMRFGLAALAPTATLADPAALLEKFQKQAAKIAGVGVDPAVDAVPGLDFKPKPPQIFPTGVAGLDEAMGGGQAGKECYLILGPTMGGKSALATQIFVEGGRFQAAKALLAGGPAAPKKPWLYFSYELTKDQMHERVAAYGARVSRNTLSASRPEDQEYSTAAKIKDYEREAIVNPCQPYTGESERMLALARELSGGWLYIVDYSGEVRGRGIGGVPELARDCEEKANKQGGIAGVVVDYAGLAVSRLRQSNSKMRPSDDYELMATFVDEVRNRVSIPFDCPAWVLHQFHGDVVSMSPGARLHLNQGRGGRNLGDNSDFAFGIGNIDRKTNMVALWMLKHRRVAWDGKPIVCQFDGRFGTFLRPAGQWDVDPYTRQIVNRADADALAWGDMPEAPL